MLAGFSLALLSALPACRADQDGPDGNLFQGELADAPYAADAMCLSLSDAPYSNIELTGSGIYFIEQKLDGIEDYTGKRMFKAHALTRGWTPGSTIIAGTFEKLADGSYDLEEFGILKWNSATGTVTVDLEGGGGDYVWDATLLSNVPSNKLNDRLCRTWKFFEARVEFYDDDNRLLESVRLTPQQIANEYVDYFTFTRSGRMYEYEDDSWTLYRWSWSNASRQIILTVGDDEEDGDGMVQLYFKDDIMEIMIPSILEEEGDSYEYEAMGISVPENTKLVKEWLKCRPYKTGDEI